MPLRRRANPTVIGAFVLGVLVLAFAVVLALAGGNLFQRKERAVMYFRGSIYGLQVGAPVVFRGVRLGQVTNIGLAYDRARDNFSIPVTVEIERGVVRSGRRASGADDNAAPSVEVLVQRGLRAQLALQSVLTGQLYIDLDFRPDKQAEPMLGAAGGATEIPTVSSPIENLQGQIEGLNLRQMVDDLSAIAASARKVFGSPEMTQALKDLQQTAATLKTVMVKLDKQFDPLVGGARSAFASADRAMQSSDATMRSADAAIKSADGVIRAAGSAMQRVEVAAGSVGEAAGRIGALAAPDSQLVRSLQQTADELARSAAALRETTSDDSALMRNLQRALKDAASAARSLRELSDTLDRQPEALLRGRTP